MACQYIDGFDHYSTATDGGWSGGTITATNPRTGGQCLQVSTATTKTLPTAHATWIVGAAIRPNNTSFSSNQVVLEVRDGGTAQFGAYSNSDGTLQMKRGGSVGTSVGSASASALVGNVYQYVELKVTISDAAGSYELRVNGVTWLSGSSVDTKQTANATANGMGISNIVGSGGANYDDMYAFDGSGSANIDFAGDVKVTTLLPSGAGTTTGWTPSAGSNYQCVDETTANGDTDYVSTSTATTKDTYAFGDLSGTPNVKAVAVALHARKDDAGTRTAVTVVRHSSTDYDGGTTQSFTSSYLQYRENYDTNPGTASAWTYTDVNNAEFGVKLTA